MAVVRKIKTRVTVSYLENNNVLKQLTNETEETVLSANEILNLVIANSTVDQSIAPPSMATLAGVILVSDVEVTVKFKSAGEDHTIPAGGTLVKLSADIDFDDILVSNSSGGDANLKGYIYEV